LPVEVWSELKAAGYKLTPVPEQEAALQLLKSHRADLLVTVREAGKEPVLDFLKTVREEYPELPVLVIDCEASLEEAVEAMKIGAADYVPGSLVNEHLMSRLAAVMSDPGNGCEIAAVKRPAEPIREKRFIAEDEASRKVLTLVRKIAPSRATVLIEGESGTGKELVARQIHALSGRGGMPFVAVNCAALPEHLLESELFGFEKGAFTGAVNRRLGKFELAHRGTLLLDEISEMDRSLQAKLLRVLQEGEIDRLGGSRARQIDTRVVATTNQDLEKMVAAGSFRQDLFFRLNVVRIVLPPLRERPEDIVPLSRYFLRKSCARNNLPLKKMTPAAEAALLSHSWPGNVRELENTVERAALLSERHEIDLQDLFPGQELQDHPATSKEASGLNLRKMEQRLIYAALDRHAGNRTHAARALGISVRTLRNKLNEYKKKSSV